MTQPLYDRPEFFDAYGRLPRSVAGLDGAPEWPALRGLLPPMAGRSVVDLGCGFGWFARWAAAAGAASVLGLDVSQRMLDRAAEFPADDRIRYARQDLDALDLPGAGFDLAFSSLTLHYLVDLQGFLRRLHGALRPGSPFVLSMEHPVFTAPRIPGWGRDAGGRRNWPIDSYFIEGPRVTDWLAPGVVKQHRTLETLLASFAAAGFALERLREFCPDSAQIAAAPTLAEERERPMFLLLALRRDAA